MNVWIRSAIGAFAAIFASGLFLVTATSTVSAASDDRLAVKREDKNTVVMAVDDDDWCVVRYPKERGATP